MGYMILRRVLMIPCEVLLSAYFRNARSIPMLGSGLGIVDVLGDTLYNCGGLRAPVLA